MSHLRNLLSKVKSACSCICKGMGAVSKAIAPDSMEGNKLFAAILIAGIVAMLAGFIAEEAIHPHELETDAVAVDGSSFEGGGGASAEAKAEPVLALIASADIATGEKLTKACAACHSFEKGGPVKTGPDLWNVMTRGRAADASFAYSEGLKAMGGQWTYLDMNKFLWKPKKLVADTKMNFIGLKKPEDRAAVIAYLRAQADSPNALPTDAEIAAEVAELAPPVEATAEGEAASPEGTVTEGATPDSATAPATDTMPVTATEAQSAAETEKAEEGAEKAPAETLDVKPSNTPGSAATGDKEPPVKAE